MKYINFSQLRSFHAVAKTQSITLASKLLNISHKLTITKQIQLLEEFYSINVINRHARGVTFTDLGKKLYELTSGIFEPEEKSNPAIFFKFKYSSGDFSNGYFWNIL